MLLAVPPLATVMRPQESTTESFAMPLLNTNMDPLDTICVLVAVPPLRTLIWALYPLTVVLFAVPPL